MNPRRLILFLAFSTGLISPGTISAEVFRFRYVPDSQFKAVARVDETVTQRLGYQQAVQQSELRYKIAYKITAAGEDYGDLEGVFQIANRSTGDAGAYQWAEEHPTAYRRDLLGHMQVSKEYTFPVVRNVPSFPERDVAPGETWVGVGEEVHDFRDTDAGFGVVKFPINVAYTFRGKGEFQGVPVDLVDAVYQVYHRFSSGGGYAPVSISGFSSQHLFWDNTNGFLRGYTEEFELVMQMTDGSSWTFAGTASAEITTVNKMEKEAVAEDIRKSLDAEGVEDSSVRIDEEGVTIALHNIRFLPDSSRFVPGEEAKIAAIAQILKQYPQWDVLITGHTALAGTREGREKLSLERAGVVADYLVRLGARSEDSLVIRGMGAREPVADNATEAGKRLNRRVEITLLEN